jgi:hypothetical protein
MAALCATHMHVERHGRKKCRLLRQRDRLISRCEALRESLAGPHHDQLDALSGLVHPVRLHAEGRRPRPQTFLKTHESSRRPRAIRGPAHREERAERGDGRGPHERAQAAGVGEHGRHLLAREAEQGRKLVVEVHARCGHGSAKRLRAGTVSVWVRPPQSGQLTSRLADATAKGNASSIASGNCAPAQCDERTRWWRRAASASPPEGRAEMTHGARGARARSARTSSPATRAARPPPQAA